MRTVRQASDPIVRQPQGIAETVKAGVPNLSTSVEPGISRFGEPVVREGGPLRRVLDPFNVSSVVNDPVKRDLLKLPDDVEANLRALLDTPPSPAGTPGSRKVAKPTKRKRKAGKKR